MEHKLSPQRWERMRTNPTLYRGAFAPGESPQDFPWHTYAYRENSSQVFCVSAFHTLRHLRQRDQIVSSLLVPLYSRLQTDNRIPLEWNVHLEHEEPSLLGEFGSQPTSIDVLLETARGVICIESKFARDAREGLGGCSQVSARKGSAACRGFHGPGSDIKNRTDAWCRLETQDGRRPPTSYWSRAKDFFQPYVFHQQHDGDICPLRDGNYQLMRNFLFAAMLAQQQGKLFFGVMVICPDCTSSLVKQQVADFKKSILLPAYADRVQFVAYEDYIGILRGCGSDAVNLAGFLEGRIKTVAAASA